MAISLIIIALILSSARLAITEVNRYKVQLIEWIASEHDINVSVDDISAGVDFSGLVLTLQNVSFVDAPLLPFELKLDHLFLHLDFLNSIKTQEIVFNDISLKGANLLIKPSYGITSTKITADASSKVTLESLKTIFLSSLNSFSIKDSEIHFTDHLYNKKMVFIQDLSWFNKGEHHQGVGKAFLPDTLGDNDLSFLIDITGDAKGSNEQLTGQLYAHAEHLNIRDYLAPQINPLADLKTANVSFKLWSEFDFNGPKNVQFQWGSSHIAWSMLDKVHDLEINHGLLQFSYQNKNWLFDSYDLDMEHNFVPWSDVELSGFGIGGRSAIFNLKGVNLNSIVPFALLFSQLPEAEVDSVKHLEISGDLTKIEVLVDEPGTLTVGAQIDSFNNQAVGVIPGISNANLWLSSNPNMGTAKVELGPQEIYFDGQFNRSMPLQKGEFELNWTNDANGFELFSQKSLLVTDDLESETQFSLFFPSKASTESAPFLSLYTYASLNDAAKAQHYFPIKAMGEEVFNYLQPTLKKGTVDGAKILWYGALSDYPYLDHNGVFQAFVPLREAEYDFYDQWEGLSDLNIDLLFENDALLMQSEQAQLGDIDLFGLTGKIDHLAEKGVVTITADVEEEASAISKYLITSPLKESVGEALKIINVNQRVRGDLVLNIPISAANGEVTVIGKVALSDNDVDIKLGDALAIPFKQVSGTLHFNNGTLTAKGLSAKLFEQPINFSFLTQPHEDEYQVNVDLSGQWDTHALSVYHPELSLLKLSGMLDWQGEFAFSQFNQGGYEFDLDFSSPLQGTRINLPIPYNKNALQTWPTTIHLNGNQDRTQWDANVSDKLTSAGELNYQEHHVIIPYAYLGLGNVQSTDIDKHKQVIRIKEKQASITDWVPTIQQLLEGDTKTHPEEFQANDTLIKIDDIYVELEQAELFNEPLKNVNAKISYANNFWNIETKADGFSSHVEYRKGIPDRFDIQIDKMNFQQFDVEAAQRSIFKQEDSSLPRYSDNLREEYPEVFLECRLCFYKEMQLSELSAHVFPSKSRYTIDYLKLGKEDNFTQLSGIWDQRRTNIIVDSKVDSDTSIVKRLGYESPVTFKKGEFSGAFNWIGAPWQFNFPSLNGAFSTELENGMITEVDDKGARLLGFLSLDGIRRSLNIEFGEVFSKGLGFDVMSLSGNINNGIVKNDDYYLDGSAGKISGTGLVDLPNLNVNYRFNYSPAVTSSLPVLAAFTINPLTGAAVLMLTKLLEPVVDAIVRVDFSVKGALFDPVVKIESSEKGKIKLQNSAVLEKMAETQLQRGEGDAE